MDYQLTSNIITGEGELPQGAVLTDEELIAAGIPEGQIPGLVAADVLLPQHPPEIERPDNPEVLGEEIVTAISRLEAGNIDHWTKSGKPEVRALEAALGYDISAAERDAAWAACQANKAAANDADT